MGKQSKCRKRLEAQAESSYSPRCFHPADKASSFWVCRCKLTDTCGSNRSCCSVPVLLWRLLLSWNPGRLVATGNGLYPEVTSLQRLVYGDVVEVGIKVGSLSSFGSVHLTPHISLALLASGRDQPCLRLSLAKPAPYPPA